MQRIAVLSGASLLIWILSLGTVQQNTLYYSDEMLWRRAAQANPDNLRARCGLAASLIAQNKSNEGGSHLLYALSRCPEIRGLSPQYARALNYLCHNDLGVIDYRSGRYRDAEMHFAEALKILPEAEETRRNLQNARSAQKGETGR